VYKGNLEEIIAFDHEPIGKTQAAFMSAHSCCIQYSARNWAIAVGIWPFGIPAMSAFHPVGTLPKNLPQNAFGIVPIRQSNHLPEVD